jgi:internalin A
MKFEYFIPFGIINQLICHYGVNPNKKLYWRDQLLFTNREKNCKVLIKLDFTNLEILVSIKIVKKESNFDEIQKEIFKDIIDIYWNDKTNKEKKSKFKEKKIVLKKDPNSLIAQTIKDDEVFIDTEIKSPEDLYLSVDNKNFVHYKTFSNTEFISPKIATYGLTTSSKMFLGKQVEVRTLNKDKIREQSVSLFKNFTNNKNIQNMKKIFISYSRKDVEFKDELKKHLNILHQFDIADNWSCEEITIGKWEEQIQKELEESDLIIYMLSANFFSSKYILDKEVKRGMDLINDNKKKNILCVVVSDFIGLDKLKIELENRNISKLQEALLQLASFQYLPYDKKTNNVTGNEEELIVPLKIHSNIEGALKQITEKVLEEVKG